MTASDPLAAFPNEIPASLQHPELRYKRLPNLFAVHGQVPDSVRRSASLLLDEGAVAVVRGVPGGGSEAEALGAQAVTPVYGLGANGAPAVPTGLVLVRFADEVPVEQRREELARAGYVVAEVLSYAPQAAWVRARDGDIAAALAGIDRLKAIPGVANVEPQMLRERVVR